MWTIYDIHSDLYWNAQRQCWCAQDEASLYSVEERDGLMLRSVGYQWRYIAGYSGSPRRRTERQVGAAR
jgi:hypothetical protein